MNKQKGNITKIAEVSGVDRAHLYRKFKNLGIKIK
jgi:transcriptional regulator of acetoin/glycerol metabolism